jgi:hypothetical protein
LGEWKFLSAHFFEKGETSLGIRLAQAVLKVEPTDPYLIVKLAQLYRKAEQPEQSVQVFRSIRYKVSRNERPFYYEWGTSEGNAGNYALNTWLAAFSLADEATRQPPGNEDGKQTLNGFSIASIELYERYNNLVFIEACAAASQLGLTLKLDHQTKIWLEKVRAKASEVKDVPPKIAIERIQAGVAAAWEQREEELPDWVTPGNKLTFNGLERLLRIA